MKKQVLKMVYNGVITVVYDDSRKYNPFVIQFKTGGHVKTIEKYADFGSCLYFLDEFVNRRQLHDQWKP